MLDKITELCADGSQLVAEVFMNSGASGDALNAATQKWHDTGSTSHWTISAFRAIATTPRPIWPTAAGSRFAPR